MDQPERAFLDVEESVTGQRWRERATRIQLGQAQAMAEQVGINELVARIMAGRGVTAENAEGFLTPTLRDLMPDPSTLTAMDIAAARLAVAVERA